jgi:hypothetical protein
VWGLIGTSIPLAVVTPAIRLSLAFLDSDYWPFIWKKNDGEPGMGILQASLAISHVLTFGSAGFSVLFASFI